MLIEVPTLLIYLTNFGGFVIQFTNSLEHDGGKYMKIFKYDAR